MFGAVRYDDELTGFDDDVAATKPHLHPARDDEKQFILGFMVMPVELAGELHQLDL